MKVIKKGKVVEDIFEGDCTKCGSTIQAKRSEIARHITLDSRAEGDLAYVKCPVCKGQTKFFMYPV